MRKDETLAVKYLRERRERFLDALTDYLTKDEWMMSVKLEAGDEYAKTWASLRNATPLFGYYDMKNRDKAREELREFFGWS